MYVLNHVAQAAEKDVLMAAEAAMVSVAIVMAAALKEEVILQKAVAMANAKAMAQEAMVNANRTATEAAEEATPKATATAETAVTLTEEEVQRYLLKTPALMTERIISKEKSVQEKPFNKVTDKRMFANIRMRNQAQKRCSLLWRAPFFTPLTIDISV